MTGPTDRHDKVAASKSERIKVAAKRLREIAEVVRGTMGPDEDAELGWSQALEEVAHYLETGR